MKTIAISIMICFMLAANGVMASESPTHDQGLHDSLCDTGQKLKAQLQRVMAEYKGLNQANKRIKEAGLSYQKALTVNRVDLKYYIAPRQQAVMAGIYTFDATYAALFLKKKELVAALTARRGLAEGLGFGMAMPPKLKKLVENPETIKNFDQCSQAFNEVFDQVLADQLTTDKRLVVYADGAFGALIEGLYVVTESIAQAGYSAEALSLMDQQRERIECVIKILNVFKGEKAFEDAVALKKRIELLDAVKAPLQSPKFTRESVDKIRTIVSPLRQDILDGKV